MSNTTNIVRDAVTKAVAGAAASSSLDISARDIPAVTERVAREVAPLIENLTNNESLWRSRVVWGALLSAIGATAGLFGYVFDSEIQTKVVNVIMLWVTIGPVFAGAALTLYGRLKANKPIGK